MRADLLNNNQQKSTEFYKERSETLINQYFQSTESKSFDVLFTGIGVYRYFLPTENKEARKEKLEALSALFVNLINDKIPEAPHFDSNLQALRDLVDPVKNENTSGADLNKIKKIVMDAIFNKINTLCSPSKHQDSGYPIHEYSILQSLVCSWDSRHVDYTYTPIISSSFKNVSGAQWAAFCAGIKYFGVTSLNLRRNEIGKLTDVQWKTFWAGVKASGITSVDLSFNGLNALTPEEWTAFWVGIKASGITSLNLAFNSLNTLTPDQWTAFWVGIKASGITSLNLACNGLNHLSDVQWTAFWVEVKESNITSLDLSGNFLSALSGVQWTAFCAGVKASNITSLSLAQNRLNPLMTEQWTAFCVGIKASNITSLSLACNYLNTLTPDQWTAFSVWVKESNITSLDLSRNCLNTLTPEQWTAFCVGIKASKITSLDLSQNNFATLNDVQWTTFKNGLADSSVVKLTINDNYQAINGNKLTNNCVEELKSILEKNNKKDCLKSETGSLKALLLHTIFREGMNKDAKFTSVPIPTDLQQDIDVFVATRYLN